MPRKWAILWHALFSIGAGFLYFYFVLPRGPELTGETSHSLGTAFRIVTGALIGLAALPVVFTLLRSRKPELGTPQLALSIRTCSIVAHVLAGVLILGTAIAEIWVSLDNAGQYLFGIYGAAAAIAVLGFFAFYLSFVAELPPPPPKPIKAKKPKRRRIGRLKKGAEAAEADAHAPEAADETEETDQTDETKDTETPEPTEETVEAGTGAEDSPDSLDSQEDSPEAEDTDESEGGLRNRRPAGKASHRLRRRRTPGGIALDE